VSNFHVCLVFRSTFKSCKDLRGVLLVLSYIACSNHRLQKHLQGHLKEHLTISLKAKKYLTVCCPKTEAKDNLVDIT
jgi:hypothetical protein